MTCKKCGMPEIVISTPQYHYLESGLKNIYLSPTRLIICERCFTKRPQINDISLLNMTIAEAILLKSFALEGAELQFLRKNLGYSTSRWAECFHLEEENILALENDDEPITPQFDLLTRLFYVRLLEENSNQTITIKLIDKFAHIDFNTPDNSILLINLDTPPKYYYLQSSPISF
jgi:hypothetical protein